MGDCNALCQGADDDSLPPSSDSIMCVNQEGTDVPWQRIINASSTISPRGDGGAAARRQAERLREEGVAVTQVRYVY